MQKAFFWMLMGFVLFAVLVGAIFGYLSYKDTNAPAAEQTATGSNKEVNSLPEYITKSKRDSLVNLINKKDSIISARINTNDSLKRVIRNIRASIDEYKGTIKNLEEQLTTNQNKAENIKNLAKTYESLRVNDMAPILKNIGDNTLIGIYNKMSSRKRMKLLQALPPARAARLTNKLAN